MSLQVCVFGAGAIGGHLAHRLAAAGHCTVNVVARGSQLDAIRRDGITLESAAGRHTVRPALATDQPASLPPQDLVFVTLKATAQPAAAQAIGNLLRGGGQAVFFANGIPWWWHARQGAPDQPLRVLDPSNALGRWIGSQRSLGGVVTSQNEVVAPGVVRHLQGNRWLLGLPCGSPTSRLIEAVDLLCAAGLHAEPRADLRQQVWLKLLRNLAFGPGCALLDLALEQARPQPALQQLAHRLLDEATLLAAALGHPLPPGTGAAVLEGLPRAGSPSMRQDRQAGRPMEVEAQIGALEELAADAGLTLPTLSTVALLLRGANDSL